MQKIFQDLVVVELASVLAGPAVGMFFAELGAKVIKIENPLTNGDVTRTWKIKGETNEIAAYYYAINYNKESHFLNLRDQSDYEKLIGLLDNADILISNYNDSTAEKLAVDYPTLAKAFPSLIYAQLLSFKNDTTRPAYDVILQAETGFLSMSGINENQLCKMPVALIDVLAAHQLKEGILIALLNRNKTGRGSIITSSLEESALASLVNQATNYLMAGHVAKPMGTLHPNIAPYGDVFYLSDQSKIVLAVGSDKQFSQLCEALKISELASDPRFHNNLSRVSNRTALIEILQNSIKQYTLTQFILLAKTNHIPYGHIKNIDEVLKGQVAQSMILRDKDNNKIQRISGIGFKVV